MERLNGFKFEGNNEHGDYVMTVEVENGQITVENDSHLGHTVVFNEATEKLKNAQGFWEELKMQNLNDLAYAIGRKVLQNSFCELNGDPNCDWSYAADLFLAWNCEESFKTKSFEAFVEYMTDEPEMVFGNKTWGFFFGYGDNFESFMADWVDDEEHKTYLAFCKKHDYEL